MAKSSRKIIQKVGFKCVWIRYRISKDLENYKSFECYCYICLNDVFDKPQKLPDHVLNSSSWWLPTVYKLHKTTTLYKKKRHLSTPIKAPLIILEA